MADIKKTKAVLKAASQEDSPFGETCEEILEYIEQLEERIAIMEEGGWIFAKERLPEVEESPFGKSFIVYAKGGAVFPLRFVKKIVRGTWVQRWQDWNDRIYRSGDIVAWMPLPEPPKDGEVE